MNTMRRSPYELGPMPDRRMTTVDELIVHSPRDAIFELAADVEQWPALLPHYRYVRFHERGPDGGGIVEMSANRPFGAVSWPTWWTSLMAVGRSDEEHPWVRFRHVRGITRGMEVAWTFEPLPDGSGTRVRIVHAWNGPRWPLIGAITARLIIGPVFVHGIASRTLSGLARAAERTNRTTGAERG